MSKKNMIMPTVVLVVVTFIITFALVVVNGKTKDKIAELQLQTENEAKSAVLPSAESFIEDTVELDGKEYVYWAAENGSGYVFKVSNKGYGGDVVIMVGIDSDAVITGLKVVDQSETAGLGAKSADESFGDRYCKPIPDQDFVITKTGATADYEIDAISAATITSKSVCKSANQAVALYKLVTGGAN